MSEERRISEEMRGAFADRQLDPADWAAMAGAMERDPALRQDVCELRMLKDAVRHAYAAPPARPSRASPAGRTAWSVAAAAVLLATGWLAHAWWSGGPALDPASAYALRGDWHTLRGNWRTLDAGRVLVHVSSERPEALGRALDEVADLLRAARAERRRVEIEIVANNAGLDMLRADASPLATRLAALRVEYPNLGLVACGQTLERRRARGESPRLLPHTVVAPSALQHVVERLREGWVYVRA
jgi:intracellular sulfur oxidation DsrE/DsrF family protein